MMKTLLRLAGLGMIVLVLVRAAFATLGTRDGAPSPYHLAAADRGDIQSTVSATGTLNAVTTVHVGSQISGIIQRLHASFNDPVKKGQVLAEIDPASFAAAVDQARADVEAAQAAIEAAANDVVAQETAIEEARASVLAAEAQLRRSEATERNRAAALRRSGGLASERLVSQQELENATVNHSTAIADTEAAGAQAAIARARVRTAGAQREALARRLRVARAQLSQRRATLALAEVNLSRTRVVSPIDGVVLNRSVDIGQTVAASFQTPTLFVIADHLEHMQIDANIDEADIGRVQVGQHVEFTVDAHPEERFSGRVEQIRLQPIVSQNVVSYDAVVRVDNRLLLLRSGMTASLKIQVARATGVLRVPSAAFAFSPSNGDRAPAAAPSLRKGRRTLHVLSGAMPVPLEVGTGISDGTLTEVVPPAGIALDRVVLGLAAGEVEEEPRFTQPFALKRKK